MEDSSGVGVKEMLYSLVLQGAIGKKPEGRGSGTARVVPRNQEEFSFILSCVQHLAGVHWLLDNMAPPKLVVPHSNTNFGGGLGYERTSSPRSQNCYFYAISGRFHP